MQIERNRIEKIEYKESETDAFKKRVKSTDMKDPDAVFELAMWCKENGKKMDYRKYLTRVLDLDDQHDEANQELGRLQFDGKWFTAEGLDQYKADKEKRMKALGMIEYNGIWMLEHEARKLMGYEEWEGEWITKMAYYHRMGERDIPNVFGHPMTITDSEHFTIRSMYKQSTNEELLDYCELEMEHFLRTIVPDETEFRMMTYYPIPVYILQDLDESDLFVKSKYIKRYNPPKEDMERYRPKTNFSIYFPRPLVALTEGRHLVGGEDKLTSQVGYMSHHVGHILIRRFKRGGKVPGWIETGLAHYYEGLTNFHQTLSVCEYRDYEDVEKWIMGYGGFMEWKKQLTNPETHKTLPTVRDLFDLKIETMNTRHMAKAWSVVTFLIKHHREEFVIFCRRSFAPYRGEKSLSQEETWKLAFKNLTPLEAEIDWCDWIVKQPLAPSRLDKLRLPDDE